MCLRARVPPLSAGYAAMLPQKRQLLTALARRCEMLKRSPAVRSARGAQRSAAVIKSATLRAGHAMALRSVVAVTRRCAGQLRQQSARKALR